MIKTNIEKFGFECCLQNKDIREKVKKTNLEKFGFENAGKNSIIHEKMKQTMFKKYGVNFPLQNSEIASRSSKNCYKPKRFIFPSGKEIICQGYEPFALQSLIDNNIEENDIITGCKNVPSIWYNDETGKKHRHYVDIFIPSQNKCIEVKSIWTFEKKDDYIFLKQNAAKKLGYNYEIWVYDNKGNIVETHI